MRISSLVVLILFFKSLSVMGQNFSAMTYNIRLDIASDGPNAWEHRKEFLGSQILFFSPDVLGVQEARPNQKKDLTALLPNYRVFGAGRDGGDKGEHTAIFYNTDRLRVEKQSTFWLSKTPNKVSMGWDAAYPRICTYGLFTTLKTKKKFWVFNTHLDHVGKEAQLQGIKTIQKKIQEVNKKGYPVILMGDLNVEPESDLIKGLGDKMDNTAEVARHQHGPNGTFNGFHFDVPVTRLIDYIFISKPSGLHVLKQAVLSDSNALRYPSDHFPVYVEFAWK